MPLQAPSNVAGLEADTAGHEQLEPTFSPSLNPGRVPSSVPGECWDCEGSDLSDDDAILYGKFNSGAQFPKFMETVDRGSSHGGVLTVIDGELSDDDEILISGLNRPQIGLVDARRRAHEELKGAQLADSTPLHPPTPGRAWSTGDEREDENTRRTIPAGMRTSDDAYSRDTDATLPVALTGLSSSDEIILSRRLLQDNYTTLLRKRIHHETHYKTLLEMQHGFQQTLDGLYRAKFTDFHRGQLKTARTKVNLGRQHEVGSV